MPGVTDGGLPELTSHLVLVKNQSSENAPPFAALEVTGFDADTGAYLVTRPTRLGLTTVLFNGSQSIEAGEEGQASGNRYSVAAWADDGSGEEPAAGDAWGTEPDNWYLVRRAVGFKVIARPEGAEYETVLVEPMDLTPVGTVEVTDATATGTPPDDLYYPAKLVAFDPAVKTWATLVDEVWYHSIDGIAPKVEDRIPCVHEGFGSGRPVFGARLANPGAKTTGCTPEGWGWSTGLWTNECLYFEVLNKYGACSAIDATQWAYLKWDGVSKWVSQRWNCLTLAWEDWEFAYDGGSGQVSFEIDTDGDPKMVIAGAPRDLTLSCGGAGVVVFTLGGPAFCGGGGSTGEVECENYVQVRVSCVCCPVAGWDGPGYYCIADEGEDCDVALTAAVYLYDWDKCRTDFVICSCRFDTLEEAEAECGGGGAVTASCPPKADFNTNPPTVTVSNKTGDCTCLDTSPTPWVDGVDGSIMYFVASGCVGGVQFKLECAGGEYTLTTGTSGVAATCIAYTATPFSITFRVIGMGANCNYGSGGFDVTIDAP